MRKGIMAMEGLEEVIAAETPAVEAPPVVEPADTQVEDATAFIDAPEAELVEASDCAAEVVAVDDEIGEAEDTAETLGQMETAVAASVEEGGMSEPVAEAVRVAVEHFRTRLGFPKTAKKVFPAMEGFKEPGGDRVKHTKLALEGIQDTIATIWKAIVAAFAKAVEWVSKFYKHITDGAVRLKARAGKLAEAAKALEGKSAAADAKVAVPKALGPVGGDFVQKFGEFTKAAAGASAEQLKLAKDGSAALNDMLNGVLDGGSFDKAKERFVRAKGGEQSVDVGFGNTFNGTGITRGASGEAGDAAPLSAKEVLAVAAAAESHLAAYDGFSEAIAAIKKASDAAIKTSKSLTKAGENEGFAERSKEASKAAREFVQLSTRGAQALRSYDITVTGAALAFGAASLKAIGGAKEAAPAAAAAAA